MRWIILTLLCAWATPGSATTVRAISAAEMSRQASLIVVGVAGPGVSYWDGGRIKTRVAVQIEKVLAGDGQARSQVQVTTLGGAIGGLAQRVEGTAVLAAGERVALFLARDPEGTLIPLAMAQGVFHFDRPHDSGEHVARGAAGAHVLGTPPAEEPTTLTELEAIVVRERHGRP